VKPHPQVQQVRQPAFAKMPDGTNVLKVVEPMPETKTQRHPAANKQAANRPRRAAHAENGAQSAAKATRLPDDVLKSLEEAGQSAIEAVRQFMETVDRALPSRGEGLSRREEITDSALEMAQRLVHTQYDFLRKVVDSAGRTLTRSDDAK
jgi:hypothetical protein